jgi:hypothetical protein
VVLSAGLPAFILPSGLERSLDTSVICFDKENCVGIGHQEESLRYRKVALPNSLPID